MLYAVFRIGEATNNIRWQSYRALADNPAVAWSIPLSLGDSHHGFPVVGTSSEYFEHFHYGDAQSLAFAQGRPFAELFDAVLGGEVAERLGYHLGDRIVLNHGMGDVGLAEHTDKPFTVVGILANTGTPVDRSVHISLPAMEAIHLDWQGGAPLPGLSIPAEYVRKFDLTPKEITAVLVGLHSRAAVFKVQRQINTYAGEPLLAVLPGVALDQLWQVVGVAERTLLAVSAMVVATDPAPTYRWDLTSHPDASMVREALRSGPTPTISPSRTATSAKRSPVGCQCVPGGLAPADGGSIAARILPI